MSDAKTIPDRVSSVMLFLSQFLQRTAGAADIFIF